MGDGNSGIRPLSIRTAGRCKRRAALINAVLNHQGQEQHSIDVPDVQLLDADRNLLTFCSLAPTPGVQDG
ncbi:MAG: hypothetical protein FRX49_11802 [Trebouxia sp. A1-2]|nr:MAG: hypothetical protein FRX49_11802 [Trebouxia sp. A1-2]